MTIGQNSLCESCKEVESSRSMCVFCETLVPHITGQQSGLIQNEETIERFRNELKNPESDISQIWRRVRAFGLENNKDSFEQPPKDQEWLFGEPSAWSLSEEEMVAISVARTNRMGDHMSRRLARGGILPDGTHISLAGGSFHVDGHPCRIPFRGLLKMLDRHPRACKSVNWKQLLRSVDLALNARPMPRSNFGGQRSPILHPASEIFAKNVIDSFLMMEMMRRISPRATRPVFSSKLWFRGSSWLDRWESMLANRVRGLQEDELKVPRTLIEKNGKLFLRVRRNRGWKRIELESDPRTWETIVTWALSPPDHDDHTRLRTLQQHIFADVQMNLVGQSDLNGIRFLREVIGNNDRASLDSENDQIVVEGTSGLTYAVIPGRGGHNTRFVVSPIMESTRIQNQHRNGWARMRQRMADGHNAICIVETPRLRRLVLGDALASITLSLLDDSESSKHINTLSSHIRRHRPRQPLHPDVQQHNRAIELRQLLERNIIEQERVRATESFPRLFSVFLRMPLGSRVTFTAINRDNTPNVRFDDSETTFSTRNINDRRVMYRMLEAAGWIRDREEEKLRGTTMIYIRTGTGNRDLGAAVEGISELLEPTVIANGIRVIAGPLWRFFERQNPGTGHLLPGTDEHIR
jgi:hypothetical protein